MQQLEREVDKLNFIKFLTLYYLDRKRADGSDIVSGLEVCQAVKSVLGKQKDWSDLVEKSIRQSTLMVLSGYIGSDRKGKLNITVMGERLMNRLKLSYASSSIPFIRDSIMKLSDSCDVHSAYVTLEQNQGTNATPLKKNMKVA